ncbi:MAG: 6-phosphogluconolactonase [Vicinamibacterales bacterium]
MSESGPGDVGFEFGIEHEVEVRVCGSADQTIAAAAGEVVEAARTAIAARGRFLFALSGGSTPRPLYERLAAPPWREQVDWSRTHLLWSDERCVPPEHPDSNYGMARAAFIDHVPIPARQVHRMRGEDDPAGAAAAYEQVVRELVGPPAADVAPPGLDLVLLGLGADGHTASLFPGRPAGQETARWVVADQDPAGRPRLTLTPPALNAARTVVFLVVGCGKAATLGAVLDGDRAPDRLPAQRVAPRRGRLIWIVDAAAARQL